MSAAAAVPPMTARRLSDCGDCRAAAAVIKESISRIRCVSAAAVAAKPRANLEWMTWQRRKSGTRHGRRLDAGKYLTAR